MSKKDKAKNRIVQLPRPAPDSPTLENRKKAVATGVLVGGTVGVASGGKVGWVIVSPPLGPLGITAGTPSVLLLVFWLAGLLRIDGHSSS